MNLPSAPLKQARELCAELDMSGKWEEIAAKDLPAELLRYVAERISEVPLDTIRKELNLGAPTDPRWRKITSALKSGMRIDATGLFLKWLRRNDSLADRLAQVADRALTEAERPTPPGETKKFPISKTLVEMITAISNLQANSIKMGKELGVFADPNQGGQGGQQVTIVVQTNVPAPKREDIVVHQENQKKRNEALLQAHNPNEKK